MQKITPFLWFDGNAEEAAQFYTSVFKNSRITNVTHYTAAAESAAGKPKGTVLTVEFELEGQQFIALNGGPEFKFNPSISFSVGCETQEEIDELWAKLTEGGEEVECGWLTDKFGVSWQIVPADIEQLISDDNPERSERVMAEVLKMVKLDTNRLHEVAKAA